MFHGYFQSDWEYFLLIPVYVALLSWIIFGLGKYIPATIEKIIWFFFKWIWYEPTHTHTHLSSVMSYSFDPMDVACWATQVWYGSWHWLLFICYPTVHFYNETAWHELFPLFINWCIHFTFKTLLRTVFLCSSNTLFGHLLFL